MTMASTIKGPIPAHPHYDVREMQNCNEIPAARVRPEAQDIAKQGRGTLCLALEIEGHTMPSACRQTKTVSKDHLKENMRRIRRIQLSAREKENEAKQPVKALWKLSKFDSVESRLKEQLQKEPLAPRPHSANFLRAHSRTGFVPQSARPASVEPPDNKLTVPKASTAREVQLIRHDVDFLRVNSLSATKARPLRRSPSVSAIDELKKRQEDELRSYRKGEMPKYLVDRRRQWEKEDETRRSNEPDPDMPPGHRLMPDDERRETLNRIQQKQRELLSELSAMPIRNDTVRIRTKRQELEQKLAKIEEALKIFSRQKVFVKLDS